MSITWVPLLVPQEDYLELAALVADRVAERGHDFVGLPSTVLDLDQLEGRMSVDDARFEAHRTWSVENLRRLRHSNAITARRWATALDVCSEQIRFFLSSEEVAEAAGMTVSQWRDACRKMTRHVKHNYADEVSWPLVGMWGTDDGRDGQMYWAVSAEQAERWTTVGRAANE